VAPRSQDHPNARFWDASVANCLLLLSTLLWRPDETLIAAGIELSPLAGTTLMRARPGKAPRKAIDPMSALSRVVDGSDALRHMLLNASLAASLTSW
jgi:hypothetical protein